MMMLAACATTDYEIEKRKAMSEDLRRLGDAYLRQGDYTNALRYYLDATTHYADDPELQYNLGEAYSDKQNYVRAIEHFQKALSLKPDMTKAKVKLGVTYIKTNDYDQAIAVLNQTIEDLSFEIYPKPQYPKYLLGWVHYKKGQYPESEQFLQEAINYYSTGIPKDPIYVQALRTMGLASLAQSEPYNALTYFEKAAPLAPKWADLQLDMARAYRMAGKIDLARKAYERVIVLAPSTDIADTAAQEAAGL